MPSVESRSVGAMLRVAREEQGLSVNDIAESTRIRSALIREIESDNFFGCGDTFYARGHLRSIAVTVGLDPAGVLAQFDAVAGPSVPELVTEVLPPYKPEKTKTARRPTFRPRVAAQSLAATARAASSKVMARRVPKPPRLRVPRPPRSSPSWISATLAAATVVALLAATSFLIGFTQGPSHPRTAGALPSAPTASPQPSPSSSVSPTPEGVSVQIRATSGSTWIRVTDADGDEVFQGIIDIGDVKDFSDPQLLTVRFGNSEAVSVVVNGDHKGSPSCGTIVCSETYALSEGTG